MKVNISVRSGTPVRPPAEQGIQRTTAGDASHRCLNKEPPGVNGGCRNSRRQEAKTPGKNGRLPGFSAGEFQQGTAGDPASAGGSTGVESRYAPPPMKHDPDGPRTVPRDVSLGKTAETCVQSGFPEVFSRTDAPPDLRGGTFRPFRNNTVCTPGRPPESPVTRAFEQGDVLKTYYVLPMKSGKLPIDLCVIIKPITTWQKKQRRKLRLKR